MSKMLWNGSIIDRDSLIDIEDRGYQFGDGIYEVIGVYDGNFFMLEEHLERLERSAKEIKLTLPLHSNDLIKKLKQLIEVNQLKEGIVYLQVTRGTAERGHHFPSNNTTPNLVAYTKLEETMKKEEDNGGIAVLTEDIRWLRCDIKTLNLLPNVLAKQKAVEHQAVEAIFYRGDIITEASSSNVFIVKDGEVYTHPANHYILNGITRRKVISICKDLQIKVNEETFTVQDLFSADEVFVTATKLDVVPILKVDDKIIGTGSPGKVATEIIRAFRNTIEEMIETSNK
ncbi:D-amino-acid transaminase [Oceanobacillus caeni]|uniref:D-alanine aminotransferase n=1 Tax=Oceanobacillus caeni TaxID=405946 RepID=A0ABR5MFR5_9BACI|nr:MULTISPECIES: D-amino-acid transaminase [Bacillaceae]KKE80186.1 D-alanine aminotransferase [Bacilli bacterium VT-13-104]PZD83426.1 D-amino-acid transaminase [Bacilli bacterium]KPH71185.1 D-alanine aminotransferase [Oceanobacillus caeni]MBU8792140.1 D-amino-acid transaminase [Oceanobacillus caeni]MCR1835365.1 D-amino-acid transaminase [Oceanobacillus caeni]